MTKSILGICLGDYKIICVEARISGSIIIHKIAIAKLPEGAITGGTIVDPITVASEISEILAEMEVSAADVVVDIPANLTFIKSIPTEKDYATVTEDQLLWELSHHINEPLESYITGNFIFDTTTILFAARKEAIEARSRILEHAGLSVLSVDPAPVATFNFISFIQGNKTNQTIVLFHADVPYSHIVFFDRGEMGYGGTVFTSPELFGLGEGKKTWREFSEDIISSIRMAIDSRKMLSASFTVEGLLFTGLALQSGIQETVSSHLGIETLDLKALCKKKIVIKPRKPSIDLAGLSVVAGLVAHGQLL